MYLKSIHLKNVGAFERLVWSSPTDPTGWHVVLGDNGAGKSTLLRAAVLALIGPEQALALRQDWNTWVRKGAKIGRVTLNTVPHAPDAEPAGQLVVEIETNEAYARPVPGSKVSPVIPAWTSDQGWFSASFGAFRRFGPADETRRSYESLRPRVQRHLSTFEPSHTFTAALDWLRELHIRRLEQRPEGDLLFDVQHFINQEGFLPHGTRLDEVTSDQVTFVDGNGNIMAIEQLSNGYLAVLSLVLELVRLLSAATTDRPFSDDGRTVAVPGVVLVDEIDVHLHPLWQREIGRTLTRLFPRVQFIVTTHSPLVVQAAEHGSVMRLPAPGSGEQAEMIDGINLERVVYGDVLDAFGTGLFGDGVTRSASSRVKLQRLAELNVRQVKESLTKAEAAEAKQLRATLPTAADAGLREDG